MASTANTSTPSAHQHTGCRAEAARTELDAAFTQHKREAAAAMQEARGHGTTASTRATRLESELDALRTSEAAAQQRATTAEARSRELSLVRFCPQATSLLLTGLAEPQCGPSVRLKVFPVVNT